MFTEWAVAASRESWQCSTTYMDTHTNLLGTGAISPAALVILQRGETRACMHAYCSFACVRACWTWEEEEEELLDRRWRSINLTFRCPAGLAAFSDVDGALCLFSAPDLRESSGHFHQHFRGYFRGWKAAFFLQIKTSLPETLRKTKKKVQQGGGSVPRSGTIEKPQVRKVVWKKATRKERKERSGGGGDWRYGGKNIARTDRQTNSLKGKLCWKVRKWDGTCYV